jgi:hypothetical protein
MTAARTAVFPAEWPRPTVPVLSQPGDSAMARLLFRDVVG